MIPNGSDPVPTALLTVPVKLHVMNVGYCLPLHESARLEAARTTASGFDLIPAPALIVLVKILPKVSPKYDLPVDCWPNFAPLSAKVIWSGDRVSVVEKSLSLSIKSTNSDREL